MSYWKRVWKVWQSDAMAFWMALSVCIWFLVIACIPPYHWLPTFYNTFIGLIFCEIALMRYYDWKPEKSPLFEKVLVGVAHLIVEKKSILIHLDGKIYTVKVTKVKKKETKDDKK